LLVSFGLDATYFNNKDFTGSTFSRIDRTVNFDFGVHQSPAPGIAGDTFSVRWHGMVYPAFSETYTFTVRSNDGVRLWIDGKSVIDQWVTRPRDNVSGSITLQGNRLYDLRLEYFDDRRTASVRLRWSSPSTPFQTVSRLYAYDTRFAAIGDFGEGNDGAADTARMVRGWDPDLIVTTGDNNYPDGGADTIDRNIGRFYHEFIGNYRGSFGPGATGNRFFPSLGNHDWETPGARPYLDYFTLPGNERYYDFVRGPVHFFVLSSDPAEPDGLTPDSVQGRWLRNALRASRSVFNVVYFHHPPYSSGMHGPTPTMQWPFREWGADVILSGHDHNYERLRVGNLPYLVVGSSAKLRPIGSPVAGSLVRDSTDVGALLIHANEKRMTLQYQLRDGRILDTLTMTPRPHPTA
jgi:hypothetical protein